ncbi:MAG: serine acetyltransferase [Chlorobium sp.]|jgi:serine O-acetyltransferase|nr:serine acetyltransferase [Chlorobium sp.]
MISATEPDWSREKIVSGHYEPGKYLLSTLRNYQHKKLKNNFISKMICPFLVMQHRFWSAVSGADIPLNSKIGGGLMIPHPNGIVIHPEAEIGPNCLIFQQVTIGHGLKPGLPVIEGHVDIGAGAKIIGNIRIGAHGKIGANAVVLNDVAEGCTAVGIPAIVHNKHQ